MLKEFKTKIQYSNRESESWRLFFQTVDLAIGYIKDVIGTLYLLWNATRAIILACQTNSGKTTFFEDVLIPHAIALGKRVVIVSNRLALSIAEKKRIMEKFKIANDWNDSGLKKQCYFGDSIVICTYQKLPELMTDPEFADDVEYLILDEAHYFISDSGFSTTPTYLLKKIPIFFKDSKRIYISATIDEVLPYICKYECIAGSVRYKLKYGFEPNWNAILNMDDYDARKREISRAIYAPNLPTPILYQMPEKYDFLNLNFFEDEKILIEKINVSNQKWLIFITSKEKGEELASKIKDSVFIDATTKEKNPVYFESLIDDEKFKNKVLISTSVFINGNNLHDADLKNIVMYQVDEVSIKQGLGRKRIRKGSGERLNLFLKVPKKSTLNKYTKANKDILEIEKKSHDDPAFLSAFVLSDAHNVNDVKKKIFPVASGGYRFADLCLEKLKNDIALYENLLTLLNDSTYSYCKKVCSYFNLEFDEAMVAMMETWENSMGDYEKRMLEISPVDEATYRENISELNKLKRHFGRYDKNKDNDGKTRPTMLPKTYNQRMHEIGSSLRVEVKDGMFYYFREDDTVIE